MKLLADAVGPLPTLGLERLDVVAGLLHRAGHEPADRVFLPAHFVHDLRERRAILWAHKQENSEKNRHWRRTGDAGRQIASGCVRLR
jgi:hypothetical protein